MKKRLLGMLAALVLCSALCVSASAEDFTGWTALESTHSGQTLSGGNYYLAGDVTISRSITVTGGVTLDLNGHVLAYENSQDRDSVFVVEGGHLTIQDSNTGGLSHRFTPNSDGLWVLDEENGTETVTGGVITGGTGHPVLLGSSSYIYYNYYGGGVYITNGQLTMTGGSIVGCSATDGGGVCMDPPPSQAGRFSMTGGSIAGCVASGSGGGMYARAAGSFDMSGTAVIHDCRCGVSGGGVRAYGTFQMSGEAVIRGCTAESATQAVYGGGVYVNSSSSFMMSDQAKIENCQAISNSSDPSNGGGVHVANSASLTLSGDAVIQNCTAKNSADPSETYGGGVSTAYVGQITLKGSARIAQCDAANGSGLYIIGVWKDPSYGKFYANGGSVDGNVVLGDREDYPCIITGSGGTEFNGKVTVAPGSTIENGTFNGEVINNGTITGGTFNGPVTNNNEITGGTFNGGVTGSGTISRERKVSDETEFLAALADQNVTTIKLMKSFTVKATENVTALTIDRAVTLVNDSRAPLYLNLPLTIAKDGALTLDGLDGAVILNPYNGMVVNGSLTVGANCEAIFEFDQSSLTINHGGTVSTQPAGENTTSGLLSLGQSAKLTVNGTVDNRGRLSVSDMTNLKLSAAIGGELMLDSMTVDEDYTLDMKGNPLTISSSLVFVNGANLTVRNASKVDATRLLGTGITGGSYYCPVDAGGDCEIKGGSFYGPVTVKYQGSSEGKTPTNIFGGTFYGDLKGASAETDYFIQGSKVTYMDGSSKYAMQVVANGGKASVPDAPSKDGYHLTGWYTEAGKKFDFGTDTVENDLTLTAQWTLDRYNISYDLNGGAANGNPDSYTVESEEITLNAPAKPGYTFTGWSGTGLTGENTLTVTIPKGSTGDRSYTAHWHYNGGSSGGSSSYPITIPDKTENGSVSVSPRSAEKGDTVTITATPDSGYILETITVTDKNGNDLKLTDKGNGKYTFTMPGSRVEVKVTFMEDNGVLSFFYDVPNGAYYYDAVKWAVNNGITSGTDANHFSPAETCTRAQLAAFLWRLAGKPVVNGALPFTDADEGAWYAEAVRWAVSEGIVIGYADGSFRPNGTLTRAQAMTMLYRFARHNGTDVSVGEDTNILSYEDAFEIGEWAVPALHWACGAGIMQGSGGRLLPNGTCTRGQLVTFLYRANRGK